MLAIVVLSAVAAALILVGAIYASFQTNRKGQETGASIVIVGVLILLALTLTL
jgi:hypothetical protein